MSRLMLLLPIVALVGAGCADRPRIDLGAATGHAAALFGQFAAYDGQTGRPLTPADVARAARRVDVILFGEEHNDAVCNQLQAQLLYTLLRDGRPVTLALEFLEADTQADADAYLAGRLDEVVFVARARLTRGYWRSHRPLVELCRAAGAPVLAANAPRRLVSQYRRAGEPFAAFRATLPPEEQRWLPTAVPDDAGDYRARFMALMVPPPPAPTTQPAPPPTESTDIPATQPTAEPVSPPLHAPTSQPTTAPAEPDAAPADSGHGALTQEELEAYFRAQLLWDEAMAESVATHRARFPGQRVLLLVGGFHVQRDGATRTRLNARRPHDRVLTLVYVSRPGGGLAWRDDDHGLGDIVVYGVAPPPAPAAP